MAIGERIRFIRNLLGMTQKYLGISVGYQENTADVRIAQYESGTRKPKEDVVEGIAYVLGVSPLALKVPDIDSYVGLMHTLFTLEDIYGLTIEKNDGKTVFRFDRRKGKDAEHISKMVDAWADISEKYRSGKISREEYDKWRYNYPKFDKSQIWVKMPSK
ncbi:MAG: helix-turn-helix transcriptional regulator [Clostridia bacterium]|nr:helix-turn-helix transcriptional regulator [Clostridia bacterium]